MKTTALGEAAAQLPWLSPAAHSLLALARLPAAAAWPIVRRDPGAVLLIVRQAARSLVSPALSFFPSALRTPEILQGALQILQCKQPHVHGVGPGFVDWQRSDARPIYLASLRYAHAAERLAEIDGRADPENAWIAGLLAPLGWLAAAATDSSRAMACLQDAQLNASPSAAQQRLWGLDQAAIARRFLRAWAGPHWLALVVGNLNLPVETAHGLGADPDLLRIVRSAIALVQQQGMGLRLSVGEHQVKDETNHLAFQDREELVAELTALDEDTKPGSLWEDPHSKPLLIDVLALAVECQQAKNALTLEQLERDHDQLHAALEDQRAREAKRLQELKLEALAEFSGGAAHEINNPLAVISGQAQYLLGREEDPGSQRALQKIIGQTQRVHQLLTELMQFARPPKPQKELEDARGIVREVALELSDLAIQRQVQLDCPEPSKDVRLFVDARQIETALACLLRNAIEAAPAQGWASLKVEQPSPDMVEFVIEDNGPGPISNQIDKLFDPFYSGRQAGRGRGLGLPTAWRLAREHGGTVHFASATGNRTRFVLSVPVEKETATVPVNSNGQTLPRIAAS